MRLTIIGASGHGKVVADIARLCGYDEIVFLDDNPDARDCAGYPVIGDSQAPVEGDAFVAIGNAAIRKKLMKRFEPITLVHPKAVIADDVSIGRGTVVMAGVVINSGARIGNGCIVNTCASVDHDCTVGDFAHISVGAHLCGTVIVGEGTWIGAGATVINNVALCSGCTVGAGAVVVRDITEVGTYIGVPAKRLSSKVEGANSLA